MVVLQAMVGRLLAVQVAPQCGVVVLVAEEAGSRPQTRQLPVAQEGTPVVM